MWNPFKKKIEKRDDSYTDTLVSAILAQANRVTGSVDSIGALEASAGLVGRALSNCKVQTPLFTLKPSYLNLIGRELIRQGEVIFCIMTDGPNINLFPAGSWDIRGDWNPESWLYRIELYGASRHETKLVPSSGVIHLRYSYNPASPWHGLSPLQVASTTGALAGMLETKLSQEMTAPVGQVLPWPEGSKVDVDSDEDDPLSGLRADIAGLKGNVAIVETTAAGHGDIHGRTLQDWTLKRIGANPPEVLAELRTASAASVYAACGIPQSLVSAGSDANSTREGARLLHSNLVNPILSLIEQELMEKLETDVKVHNPGLFHADLQARTRAVKSMFDAGYSKDEINKVVGIEI